MGMKLTKKRKALLAELMHMTVVGLVYHIDHQDKDAAITIRDAAESMTNTNCSWSWFAARDLVIKQCQARIGYLLGIEASRKAQP